MGNCVILTLVEYQQVLRTFVHVFGSGYLLSLFKHSEQKQLKAAHWDSVVPKGKTEARHPAAVMSSWGGEGHREEDTEIRRGQKHSTLTTQKHKKWRKVTTQVGNEENKMEEKNRNVSE